MKLQVLFEMCHNLGFGTVIIVRDYKTMGYLDEGSYEEMHSLYGDYEIVYFSIDDLRHATIYIAR